MLENFPKPTDNSPEQSKQMELQQEIDILKQKLQAAQAAIEMDGGTTEEEKVNQFDKMIESMKNISNKQKSTILGGVMAFFTVIPATAYLSHQYNSPKQTKILETTEQIDKPVNLTMRKSPAPSRGDDYYQREQEPQIQESAPERPTIESMLYNQYQVSDIGDNLNTSIQN
ncbi:hypothetical protein HC766_02275 [Candidatus Gracilibacteria bacterium]|nr:hypothetical protein [Candidatus Gracilibacteria bacterium]NJS41185.1 hypothetical protein [Candidatus Gracilibacteria bacterium]